jgi:signal transduction histidine kinase
MNILWLKTELLHPVDKGGKIRSYNMLKALKRNCRITYLTLDDGTADNTARELAGEYCHDLVCVPHRRREKFTTGFYVELALNLVSDLPYAIKKYEAPVMRAEITRLLAAQRIDVLVCDFLAPAVNVPPNLDCTAVLFQHNVEAMIWKRHYEVQTNAARKAYLYRQWQKMRAFEAKACPLFDSVIAVSREDREQMQQEYRLAKNKLKELSGHLRDTLEDERQRIARELHDSIGQNLNLVRIKLMNNGYANENIPSSEDKEELLKTLESSINELKEITYDLKPKLLDERGLGASLEVLVKKITEETGICGSVDTTGKEKRLDKKIELTFYRLAQESINNILKHSKARTFSIQLILKENLTKLLISDDGIGFDTNSKNNNYNSGFGLLNMHERVETYGGKLKIDSSPGNGTVLIFEIPDNE